MKNVALKNTIAIVVLFFSVFATAQEDKQKLKDQRQAQESLSEAGAELQNENFPIAEAEYREAIALTPQDDTGKYNLGTAYYGKEKNAEAMHRFKQAAEVAEAKPEKHKSWHNLGNTFMNEKKYKEAVEAYKNALRNNPNDDETRYNYALAKKMLENENNQGGGDDGDKEQNKQDQNKDDQESEDNKDNQNEGDKGDKEEDKKEQDEGEKEEDKKEGDQQQDKGKPDEKEGEGEKKPQQPQPGKLSPQQVKSLLEAMNNQEKKVQEKINAQKTKGAKVKSNKDW